MGTIDPQQIAPFNRLEAPGAEFWFGGDLIGRDVYSRTIYGARVSLAVGLGVAFFGILFGLIVGLLSGFVPWVDRIMMRVMDGLMAIPSILLAVALISLTGASLTMADVIWAMKVLRLDECGYPFRPRYPAVHEWFGRIASRPSFQTGVMGRHRLLNRAFRIKSRVESWLGIGLQRAVLQTAGT